MGKLMNLPLFPLNLFKLPGQFIHLHLFEPRYLQLMQDLLDGENKYFGIPAAFSGSDLLIGCLVVLDRIIAKNPDGTYDIRVLVIDLIEIKTFNENHDDKLYPGGSVERIDFEPIKIDSQVLFGQIEKLSQSYPPFQQLLGTNNISDLDVLSMMQLQDKDKLNYVQLTERIQKEMFLLYHLRKIEVLLMQHRAFKGAFNLN